MKINKISLYNFNSYEGHNEFDFESRDKSKNIVLIGGKNGAGKTSLFTAIKIALYGPLAFGYVGPNAHYIAKIKDCINSKAFQKNEVNAEVRLTLSLMVEREYKEYVITRNWKYINQKLEETYTVLEEGKQLANQELSYFQNYLQGLIPPDLFEFFLFDGEEVGNIFSSNSYNTYIKNAIYTLCGIDIFEIIRKFTSGYSSRANGEADDELYDQYEQLKGLAEKLEDKLSQIKEQLDEEQIKYEQIEVDLFDLETAYKNAGGITQEERDELASEYESAEKIKSETSLKIKMFVEGLMPFFIVGEFADQISKQLSMQERRDAYKYVKNSISTSVLKNALQGKTELKAEDIEILINEVLNMLKPDEKSDGEQSIHDLSKEELTRVTGLIANLKAIDSDELIEMINKKRYASERMMEINKILKSAMTDEDANRYATKENVLLKKREESRRVITDRQEELMSVETEHSVVEQQKIKALQALKENARNKHVYELSSGIASIMESILKSKTSATSPVNDEVLSAMLPYLKEEYGNPSSKYYCKAVSASNAVENAREQVAKLVGASPQEVVFTAGATESTNFIIKGYMDYRRYYGDGKNHIVTSSVEHKATLNTCKYLAGEIYSNDDPTTTLFGGNKKVDRGYEVTFVEPTEYGEIRAESIENAIKDNSALASTIYVNNEVGTISDVCK